MLISGNYVQVGYYGVAYSVYHTAAHAIWQFTLAFAPLLTMLWTQGEIQALKQWVERLLKWMAVGGVLAVFAVLLLGENLSWGRVSSGHG